MKKSVMTLSVILFSSALAGTALAAGTGNAQSPATAPRHSQAPAQQQLPDASSFSDKDLQNFAQAHKQVLEVQKEYSGKLQANKEEPKKAMQLQQEAQQKMVTTIKDSDISLGQYNQIMRLAQYDSDFRQRVETFM
ncbi:hypothetical protein A11A3_15192 [Alcanivorax hongdengensis A-11-3]|uniref:DUF4168 domain-containing protein n=1 Tax=Alcanivorax hongdengensis A-11-3 TaxID=1177179 RepID=L0W865_9GAMM|nr:DUF4168 domain-containing protein [Alcanivorax hongdengensis]EKF73159.1 hypothetical protein A11A3_15192 [Alcanivorax hongdengensis A-11-3]